MQKLLKSVLGTISGFSDAALPSSRKEFAQYMEVLSGQVSDIFLDWHMDQGSQINYSGPVRAIVGQTVLVNGSEEAVVVAQSLDEGILVLGDEDGELITHGKYQIKSTISE